MRREGIRSRRLVFTLVTAMLLVLATACRPAFDESHAEERLTLLVAAADTVTREGLRASWERAVTPETATPAPPFGLRLLTDLTRAELLALVDLLGRDHAAALRMVHDVSARARTQSDPAVRDALTTVRRLRARHLATLSPEQERVLTESADASARREAWLARHAGAEELAPVVLELMVRRNRAWEKAHDAHVVVSLHDPTLAAIEMAGWAVALDELREGLRAGAEESRLAPWDVEAADPVLLRRVAERLDAEGAVDRARDLLPWLGLPRAPETLRIDVPRSSEFSSNASYAVDPPHDVRIVVVPTAGLSGHWPIFHELGHAMVGLLADPSASPEHRRVLDRSVSESCAKVTERLVFSREWLALRGFDEETIVAIERFEAASERGRARRILADVDLESLVASEEALPAGSFEQIQREVAFAAPSGLPHWAAERSLSLEPGTRVTYLRARCAQAALYRRLRSLPGGLLGQEAGRTLRAAFEAAPGRSWVEWLDEVTGEPPSCTAWVEDVLRAAP